MNQHTNPLTEIDDTSNPQKTNSDAVNAKEEALKVSSEKSLANAAGDTKEPEESLALVEIKTENPKVCFVSLFSIIS